MKTDQHTEAFEQVRPKLMGIAYRFLGSVSEAEDIIQDIYFKWASADKNKIRSTEAWLATTCARKCLDRMKASEKTKIDYVGTWLPEPLFMSDETLEHNPEKHYLDNTMLSESLTTAFLLTLERLSPKERAAFLLHDVFDMPYEKVSSVLNTPPSACRKLVSRARQNIKNKNRRVTLPEKQAQHLLRSFQQAVKYGNLSELTQLLHKDIAIKADGGGKVPAAIETISGVDEALYFLSVELNRYWRTFEWIKTTTNGYPGFIIKDGVDTHAVISFDFSEKALLKNIYIVRNPEKLKHLKPSTYQKTHAN